MSDAPTAAPAAPAAPAPTTPVETAPMAPDVQAARTEIAELTADRSFARSFANGDPAAREKMAGLHQVAYPGEVDVSQEQIAADQIVAADVPGAPDADDWFAYDPEKLHAGRAKYGALPFAPNPDLSPKMLMGMHQVATETADALGVEPDTLHGSIKLIESSHGRRVDPQTGQPRAMDDTELARFDFLIREKAGDNYDKACDAMEAALRKAGTRGGPWLQQSILRCDPETGAVLAMRLAGMGA